MVIYYILAYFSVILAAAAQVLLKHGACKICIKIWIIRINKWIFLGLVAMLISMLLSIRALSVVPLRDLAFILPFVYIFVPVFAHFFLNEKISKKTKQGTIIILIGMIIFNI